MNIVADMTPDAMIERRNTSGSMQSAHYHGGCELYFLMRGERDYFIEDKFYKVKEGDIVFIPSSVIHRTSGKNALRTLVYFSEDFMKSYFSPEILSLISFSEPFVFRPSEKDLQIIMQDFDNMVLNFREDSVEEKAYLAGMIFKLMFSLSGMGNCYEKQSFRDGIVEDIVSYINDNYSTISGLDEIAEHFFMSKYHLCRLFSKNLGMTLITYLNMVRIREACVLIKNTEMSFTDVAIRCGYNSESYFCKLFKTETGVSPSVYRKK